MIEFKQIYTILLSKILFRLSRQGIDRILYKNIIANKSSLKIMKTDCNTISCTSRYCGQALGYCAQDACDKSSSGRALGGVSLDNRSTEIFAILQASKLLEVAFFVCFMLWRSGGLTRRAITLLNLHC